MRRVTTTGGSTDDGKLRQTLLKFRSLLWPFVIAIMMGTSSTFQANLSAYIDYLQTANMSVKGRQTCIVLIVSRKVLFDEHPPTSHHRKWERELPIDFQSSMPFAGCALMEMGHVLVWVDEAVDKSPGISLESRSAHSVLLDIARS
ncbi:hypothetical protein BC936DRAFT_147395 [Jimgerdemannia flammicorona]|uniref:Uncharacterized protein n=1 Tax=Jimgerdemannia flammicorona TaxID=994334 RepID=A0A433D5E0_9FUNG|nr:hypothetical protein BC936DRAFT_147395 [Jimgerdemannia flammicorona]